MLTVAAEKFVDFIWEGNVGKLDAFPDIWCSEKENMLYIFFLVVVDRAKMLAQLSKTQFA
jgi:hypothetical protein